MGLQILSWYHSYMTQKYAVVTGANSGVGGAISLALAQAGYFVALIGRNEERLSGIKSNTDHVDVLVNAAAIWHGESEVFAGRDFDTFPQSVVSDTLMVGLMAPTLLSHVFIPLMPPKSKIINISGVFGELINGWIPYFVSKRGLEDLTIGLASELKDRDIQVNSISLNDVATDPYKKYFPQYYPDGLDLIEIANFALKLCSPESDNVTGKIYVMSKDQPVTEQFHA